MSQIRTILCPTDFTPLSDLNLKLAIGLCERFGARLVLHHNLSDVPPDFLGVHWMWDEEHETGRDLPAAVEKSIFQLFEKIPPSIDFEAKVSRGPLEEGLLLLAARLPADLIVMGSHGREQPDHRPLTEQVIRRAPCQVVTAGEKLDPAKLFRQDRSAAPSDLGVLIAVDLAQPYERQLAAAWELGQHMPHKLHLLHVHGHAGESERSRLEGELRSAVPTALGERTFVHLTEGAPAEEILRAARELKALFIVIGGRRHSVLRRLLTRPTAVEVLYRSDRPVWFVPTTITQAQEASASA